MWLHNIGKKIPDSRTYLHLLVLLAVGILLSKAYFVGVHSSFDDVDYLLYSKQMLNGTFSITESTYSYGVLFLSTVAASYGALGQQWAAGLPSIIEYLSLILVVYFIGIKYLRRDMAFLGALSAELSAFVFLYSTRVLPDMLLGLMLALGLLILAYRSESRKCVLAAGMLFGLTVFVKFGGLAFALIIALGLALVYREYLNSILIVLGMITGLLLYQLILPHGITILTLFNRYDALQASLSEANLANNIKTIYVMALGYNAPTPYFSQIFPLGALFFYTIIGTAIAIRKRKKEMLFYAFVFWAAYLYLFLGTESLSNYVFFTVVDRYLILSALPMAVLSGHVFENTYNTVKRRLGRRAAYGSILMLIVILLASNLPMYFYFSKQLCHSLYLFCST